MQLHRRVERGQMNNLPLGLPAEYASAEPRGRCTPTIQLVGPETSKKELQELYLEVYKLHRLPGSPPGEPVLLEEALSSLEDHQGWKVEEAPAAMVRPHPEDPHSSRSGMPQKGKKDSSVERSLATVHEAHQKALAVAWLPLKNR